MKKLFCTILSIILCFLLVCCTPSTSSPSPSPDSSLDPTQAPTPTIVIPSPDNTNIVKSSSFTTRFFSFNSNSLIAKIPLPSSWTFTKTENGYDIYNVSKIGEVCFNASLPADSVVTFKYTSQSGNLNTSNQVLYSTSSNTFTRRLTYTFRESLENSFSITVDYNQLDNTSIVKALNSSDSTLLYSDTYFNTISLEKRSRILILGNSFISTSDIGSILTTMCGYDLIVDAVSRGNANTSTFAQDKALLSRIRAGEYDAVFLCGLYYGNQVLEDMGVVFEACKQSGTKHVIFPAFNENRENITAAKNRYSSAVLLDWKGEIELMLSNGVSDSALYINDSHKHSTPLAGYIGAHMIYRAVFGKIPQPKSYYDVSDFEINLLGDYSTTGKVKLIDENSLYRF